MLTTETLIPLRITETKRSRNDNEKYVTITFYDPENNLEVKTHVVSSFGNYTRWKKVINYNLHDGSCILKGNIKYKDIDVIDADSTFVMYPGVSWNDVADIVEAQRANHPMDTNYVI